MASIGHVAVGMAAARISGSGQATRRPSMRAVGLWSALSLLPDVDVIGFGLGVRYGDEWGHRGATHSFAFSIAVGLAIGLAVRLARFAPWAAVAPPTVTTRPGPDVHPAARRSGPALQIAVIASAVLVSHALLDTLTDGGLGCALLWPFDLTRYFAPWNPIPVAPIGWSFLSVYGLGVALTEMVLFGPVFWFALSPPGTARSPRTTAWFLGLWLVVIWFHQPIGDAIVSVVAREDTEYAGGYSEQSFRTIRPGAAVDEVRRLLGPPLRDVTSPVGAPTDGCWVYSRSPSHSPFRARGVCFSNGKVVELHSFWYVD